MGHVKTPLNPPNQFLKKSNHATPKNSVAPPPFKYSVRYIIRYNLYGIIYTFYCICYTRTDILYLEEREKTARANSQNGSQARYCAKKLYQRGTERQGKCRIRYTGFNGIKFEFRMQSE